MKLIADSGSSKVEWCLLDGSNVLKTVYTTGLNPVVLTGEEIAQYIGQELMPQIGGHKDGIKSIHFYGAGCKDAYTNRQIIDALRSHFGEEVSIDVESDLVGAARGLFGDDEGIACILGTGSNSGYYDGRKITDHVSPLGYILGDEGSGAVLGKHLLGDVLKNQLPEELARQFREEYDIDNVDVIKRVYRDPMPNRFLASLTPFLLKHIDEPSIHRLVLNEFKSFFVRNVSNYSGYRKMPVGFVGSVAFYFRPVLQEAATALDAHLGEVIKSPMEGLVRYHICH